MAPIGCPHCKHLLSAEEIGDGWCGACGKQIPEFALREARTNRKSGSARKAYIEEARQRQRVESRYIRLTGLIFLVGAAAILIGAMALAMVIIEAGERPGIVFTIPALVGLTLGAAGGRMVVRGRVQEDEN